MSTQAERDAMLRLSLAPGLGPMRVKSLTNTFKSARAALWATPDQLARVPGVGVVGIASLIGVRDIDTTEIWLQAEQVGASAVVLTDPEYPALLKEIDDPPPLLWVRGRLPEAGMRLVAVVGTRRATSYGREMARRVADSLARRGIGVVSGMAYGIDAEAHRAAIHAEGYSVGVLGNGIDRIYPSAHRTLALRMVETGCLLSELLPGTPSGPGQFPRRNRIISGLCPATVVVEAHEKGGALITAELANAQNREVYAVPGPIGSPASRGTNALIGDNRAQIVVEIEKMIRDLWPDTNTALAEPVVLGEMDAAILDSISPVATSLDDICDPNGLHVSDALIALLDLEFRGLVRQLAGRQFLRTALADSVRPWQGRVKEPASSWAIDAGANAWARRVQQAHAVS